MPISPENKALYPGNWLEVRSVVLARAENRCEICQLANYSIGYRDVSGNFIVSLPDDTPIGFKNIRIVLTIAHINDPNPANCDLSNLLALCQKCHNTLDGKSRAKHAAVTRKLRKLENNH